MIVVTDFAKRHFENSPGTTITNVSVEEFEAIVNKPFEIDPKNKWPHWKSAYNGYCYYSIVGNFTDAKVASIPITDENKHHLRSWYTQRRPEELPYLSRVLSMPFDYEPPKAEWLVLILYTREQILKEVEEYKGEDNDPFTLVEGVYDYYGIVGIQATLEPIVEPMTPYTAVRNALGTKWGGNGSEPNEKYIRDAADYWSTHALICTHDIQVIDGIKQCSSCGRKETDE